MDADKIFRKYLETWPDAFIMWPTKGQDKLRSFFEPDGTRYDCAPVFNDMLQYIKEECNGQEVDPKFYTVSEWILRYFHTVRGKEMAKKHMHKHEPQLAWVSFNVEPLKAIMDGFFAYFIENREMFND